MNTDPDGGSNRPKTVALSAAGDPVPRLSGVHAITEANTIITRTSVDDTNLFFLPIVGARAQPTQRAKMQL